VDDHSQATQVYLLQLKSRVLTVLQKFWSYVHTHFGVSIKIIRSDNALEFDSGPCEEFFSKHDIVHQTSCVDCPQQNGRVERKHKHILEIFRALKFQAGLPLHFWGDCVLTAVYIINRLPSSVLHNKTPFEILLNDHPKYDHMKVFGCLARASNPSRTHDKFEPRGVPCLFLGYSLRQKGYKLMNLLRKQCFVSRDLQFYEHIFPYHKDSYQQYLRSIPHVATPSKDTCLDDMLLHMSSSGSTKDSIAISPVESVLSPSPVQQSSLPIHDHAQPSSSPVVQPVRRSTRTKKPPTWMSDFVTQTSASESPAADNIDTSLVAVVSSVTLTSSSTAFLATLDTPCDPVTFSEAVKDVKWCKAMDAELRAWRRMVLARLLLCHLEKGQLGANGYAELSLNQMAALTSGRLDLWLLAAGRNLG